MKHTASGLRATISALLSDEQRGCNPSHLDSLLERLANAANEQTESREALEACQVFITPLERRKHWNEYKEDAARRVRAIIGPVV